MEHAMYSQRAQQYISYDVVVAGLSDPDTGLYEGSYEVSTLVSGVMCKATANRVFVVDDLSKTVTNMSDSRWTGETDSR